MPILGIMASQISGHLATVPSAPTIGTVTRTSTTVVSIPFTAGATGGAAITSYVATSSPSISLSVTAGTSSPLTVTGTFAANTSYTFQIAAVNSVGTGAYSSSSNSVPVYYTVGGTGPGGGIVFYDAGSTLSWGRYMEAATSATSPAWSDNNLYQWSGVLSTAIGTTSTAIGTAYTNTSAMVAQSSTSPKAGTACRNYAGGGKSDWSLPSKDDLYQLYLQRATVGGFNTYWYWSSSESSATAVNGLDWNNGAQNTGNKSQSTYVAQRAIRYF
jgi:hypothetical protein